MRGHIRKRGNRWAVVVYLGRDPSTGKERYKWYSHRTRREAEAHLAHILTQLHGGGSIPATRVTVGDYLRQWIIDYASGAVASTTLEKNYRIVVEKHLIPALGRIPLARLSPQAIQGYMSSKLNEGLSTTTVRNHFVILHEALQHAVRWGLIARNPCDMTNPPRPRKPEIKVLDEEQVRLFLAEAKRLSQYYPLYLAAITTGMRQGELLGLRWQDVDLVSEVAHVQQTFYRLGKEKIFKEPKSRQSRRTVVLPSVLVAELLKIREKQKELRSLLGSEYKDYDLIFCQPDGEPLNPHNTIQRDLRKVLERAGLPRIRFHDLRHCHATLLLQQGIHPKIVQERLGHSGIGITLDIYSHVVPGMQEQATKALERRLFGIPEMEGRRD